jgi:hypothetical protein
MSPDANADDIAFMMLEDRIAQRDYDNVSFISSAAGYYTNFRMRVDHEEDERKADALDIDVSELSPTNQSGHRGHLRHGRTACSISARPRVKTAGAAGMTATSSTSLTGVTSTSGA